MPIAWPCISQWLGEDSKLEQSWVEELFLTKAIPRCCWGPRVLRVHPPSCENVICWMGVWIVHPPLTGVLSFFSFPSFFSTPPSLLPPFLHFPPFSPPSSPLPLCFPSLLSWRSNPELFGVRQGLPYQATRSALLSDSTENLQPLQK